MSVKSQKKRGRGFTLVELLIVVAIIGILAAIAIPNLLMAVQRSKERRTMVNIRNVATSWEARATDTGSYNAAGIAGVSIPIPIDDLAGVLSPTYIRNMPTKDGWGYVMNAYANQAMGAAQPASKYVLVSAGRDGEFQDDPPAGPFSNFDCDIVFSQGFFYSYPNSIQP